MSARRSRLAVLALVTCGACNQLTDSFESPYYAGDQYPVLVDTTSGGVMFGIQPSGDTVVHPTVLDVLSPITLVDRGSSSPAINDENIAVFGFTPSGTYIQRGRFQDQQLVAVHPCPDVYVQDGSSQVLQSCTIGTPAAPAAFEAIVGMDSFAGNALRLDLADSDIFILPGIAGSEAARTYACDAVFPAPFAGGGTLILGGTEVQFLNWRVTVDACIAADPDPAIVQDLRGADALFVMSTGIGTSLITQSAYQRYVQLEALRGFTIPAPTASGSVLLPSGEVDGTVATLPTLALVANAPNTNIQRSPCRQVYASHLLATGFCTTDDPGSCPCADDPDAKQYGYEYCGVPAVVELAPPGGVPVLIVDDSDPTIQALSTELSPSEPQVDGILGTSALAALELDIDYPNNRLLGRCAGLAACSTRPELCTPNGCSVDERVQVQNCLGVPPDSRPLPK